MVDVYCKEMFIDSPFTPFCNTAELFWPPTTTTKSETLQLCQSEKFCDGEFVLFSLKHGVMNIRWWWETVWLSLHFFRQILFFKNVFIFLTWGLWCREDVWFVFKCVCACVCVRLFGLGSFYLHTHTVMLC